MSPLMGRRSSEAEGTGSRVHGLGSQRCRRRASRLRPAPSAGPGLPSHLCPTMRTRHRLGKDHPSLVLPLPWGSQDASPALGGRGLHFPCTGGKLLSWPGDASCPGKRTGARGSVMGLCSCSKRFPFVPETVL